MSTYEEQFVQGIHSDNPWWSGERTWEIPKFKRSDYDLFAQELGEHKVCVLLGPRRCGKTTLIMQLIQCLLEEKKVDPKRILFVSLDRPFYALHEQKLQDAIRYYEEHILGKLLHDSKDQIYLFADEVHYDTLWARVLKQYVDQNLPVYAIVSGSSAKAVYEGQESGAGRFHIRQMVTIKFRDALRWQDPKNERNTKELSKQLREALLKSVKNKDVSDYQKAVNDVMRLSGERLATIKACLEKYLLRGGYPEFWQNENWREISRHYQTDVFDVILQKDVVAISNIREPQKVRTLLVLIAQHTARILKREKIRETLNLQSEKTVDSYVDALAEAFLIRTAARYREGGFPSTKSRKYYAADTGLRNAVLGVADQNFSSEERGALLETAVFNPCLRLLYHADRLLRQDGQYWQGEKGGEETERDIVLDFRRTHHTTIPIEVKNGTCGKDDIKKMGITINKLKAPFGIIICKDRTGTEKGNILLLPPWAFMLSC